MYFAHLRDIFVFPLSTEKVVHLAVLNHELVCCIVMLLKTQQRRSNALAVFGQQSVLYDCLSNTRFYWEWGSLAQFCCRRKEKDKRNCVVPSFEMSCLNANKVWFWISGA